MFGLGLIFGSLLLIFFYVIVYVTIWFLCMYAFWDDFYFLLMTWCNYLIYGAFNNIVHNIITVSLSMQFAGEKKPGR